MELHRRLHIELPPVAVYQEPILDLLVTCSRRLGMPKRAAQDLRESAEVALSLITESNAGSETSESTTIDFFALPGKIRLEITNHGAPIFPRGQGNATASIEKFLQLHDTAKEFETLSIENCGRGGQKIVIELKSLGKYTVSDFSEEVNELQIAKPEGDGGIANQEQELEIRELKKGEEGALSRLFYRVYGYNYINDFVYYPEKLGTMVAEKKLISLVASLPNGRLVGHVGLLKWRDTPPVYEPCLGVTDPDIAARGLFSRIFSEIMNKAREIHVHYCFADCVTNHEYSQKLVAQYGARDTAIFAGCQTSSNQAKLGKLGIGTDPENMDRYSLVFSVMPAIQHPFGEKVLLPDSIGRMIGFILEPLNVTWLPTPRFNPLPKQGEYETKLQPAQGSVVFDFKLPGHEATESLLAQWRELLRNGYEYAAIDIPIESQGLGVLHDLLASSGFFVSGFIPYNLSEKLAVRFQAIAAKKVAFDQIKIYSETGKKLLEIIHRDYESNRLL